MNSSDNAKELLFEEWLKKADDDELNVRSILTHRDGTPSIVCFLSHQMAEKLLKGYLVYTRNHFPKIHALDQLVGLCMDIEPAFEKLKEEAALLAPFYVPARYPGDYPEFSWEDAQAAYDAALRVKNFVLGQLGRAENQ